MPKLYKGKPKSGNPGKVAWGTFDDCRLCKKVKKVPEKLHHGAYCGFCYCHMTRFFRKFKGKSSAGSIHELTELQQQHIKALSLADREKWMALGEGAVNPYKRRRKQE